MVSPSPILRAAGAFRSPYAPQYSIKPHFLGITSTKLARAAGIAGGFGVFAGTAALFFLGEIPRFRIDILERIPVIGSYWHREIPPEDNPF